MSYIEKFFVFEGCLEELENLIDKFFVVDDVLDELDALFFDMIVGENWADEILDSKMVKKLQTVSNLERGLIWL